MKTNPQVVELNEQIIKNSKTVYDLLSRRGKNIFFPKKGILAQGREASNKEINATIGTALEDNGDPLVLGSIEQNIKLTRKEAFEYAPSYGNLELRNIWKEMLLKKNPSLKGKTFSTPVVSCALTHGLSICGYLFCDEGDELIIPEPYWENYDLIFGNAYGVRQTNFSFFSNGRFNYEGMAKHLESEGEKKIIILNFPNNPIGYTPTIDELPRIVETIHSAAQKGKKIIVVIDDAYFGLVYDQKVYPESIFSKLADLHENVLAVKLDGATKEDYVWGFRVGFLTYGIKGGTESMYKALEDKTAGAIRGNISNVPQISQSLLLRAFKDANYQKEKYKRDKEQKIKEENLRRKKEFYEKEIRKI